MDVWHVLTLTVPVNRNDSDIIGFNIVDTASTMSWVGRKIVWPCLQVVSIECSLNSNRSADSLNVELPSSRLRVVTSCLGLLLACLDRTVQEILRTSREKKV